MKIQIDGANTLNKGAELMLVAVLEEIEKKHPNAVIYYNSNQPGEVKLNFPTKLNIKKRIALKYSKAAIAILSRLGLNYNFFTSKYPLKGIDLVLDASGFQFSDQWNYSNERLIALENYYKELKSNGTKVVFLPQALGPFNTEAGIKSLKIINDYCDIIIARESVSYEFAINAGADIRKTWIYPDFTLSVKGELPKKYEDQVGKVCIIPNKKMITHTENNKDEYLNFLEIVIKEVERNGKEIFLLNHEGNGDLDFCKKINSRFSNKFVIVTGLDAKEVKGLIGKSILVVSSRFHGVASALNQGVPCLATSWNHKYEMLFKDFGMYDCLLTISSSPDEIKEKIKNSFLEYKKTNLILNKNKVILTQKTKEMWDKVWELI